MKILSWGMTLIAAAVLALYAVPASSATTLGPVRISGLDLHDGTIVQVGNTWYMYGTRYGCGFEWRTNDTPFCGFGVATASSPSGPWSKPRLLFNPSAKVDDTGWKIDHSLTWQQVCGWRGSGCFNPRMIRRTDGVYILWFNAPGDWYRFHANAYWVMGCNGPAGPCGAEAGAPHGSTHKPVLTECDDHGDFSIVTQPVGRPVIICSNQALSEEQLDGNWTNGDGIGSHHLAGLGLAEGEGAYQLANGTWEMTYSDPGCGYCSGTKSAIGAISVRAGYATSTSLLGPWKAQGYLSAKACTGQPRTITAGDYEWVDEWTGSFNETRAKVLLEPMSATPWTCQS
jgi:hypothetical protein